MKNDATSSDFKRLFLIFGISTVALFVGSVVVGMLFFRAEIREQILQRDGVLLTSVSQFLNESDASDDLIDIALINLALESSDLDRVIAVRVFHPLDELISLVPNSTYPVQLSAEDIRQLSTGEPVIRYFPDYPLFALFRDFESFSNNKEPLVEVVAPLAMGGTAINAGIQYWTDGAQVATEFARLDTYLLTMGMILISIAVIVFSLLFLFAFNRLSGMSGVLQERNRSLEKANADLSMAARTSAIGTVTSHLFHGLKNPLAGLKTYLKVTDRDEEAVAMTDRMQTLIDETLSVIREQDSLSVVNFSIQEIAEILTKRLEDIQSDNKPSFTLTASGDGQLESQKVQLLILVLRNLVENAMEAMSGSGPVKIALVANGESLQIEVSDSGPGLPEDVQRKLFEPVQSSKSGGTGIGLAISSVLARYIPASLELKSSNSDGTTFLISMSLMDNT